MQKIINVISGKGGTGKTLLTTVLADTLGNTGKKVLVIDLDIFVRGFTTLLYYQKHEAFKITKDNELTVADCFKYAELFDTGIAIQKYHSFDIVPSVSAVNEHLELASIMPATNDDANCIINRILTTIPSEYDYIFLDSRAGYDLLIEAAHELSTFSICVEEDDAVARITSENLVEQLKHTVKNKPILRIRNKSRNKEQREENSAFGLDFAGNIPFDFDVMNSFGTDTFWDIIGRSLFKDALIDVWNFIAKKMNLDDTLKHSRISPIANYRLEKKLAMFSSVSRILFLYGMLVSLLGIIIVIFGSGAIYNIINEPIHLLALITSVVGFLFVVVSVFINNKS